jgi:predicted amidohydrolase YtcJ
LSVMVPDFILYSGTVRTLEQAEQVVSSIAICGKKIVALGNDETVCGFAGPKTHVIDLRRRANAM